MVLLLAAAAVATAVRWDDIGQSAKLSGLVILTAAMIGSGRRLEPVVPVTSRVLFHLGVLLVPFDVATVLVLVGRGWEETLLTTSLLSVVVWMMTLRFVDSLALRIALHTAVVGVAAGVAATTALSFGLVMAMVSVVALMASQAAGAGRMASSWAASSWTSTVWAAVAAFAAPAGALAYWASPEVTLVLGLHGAAATQTLMSAVLATIVLAAVARETGRVETAWCAVSAGLGVVFAATGLLASALPETAAALVAVGAGFMAVELVASATRDDHFWGSVTTTTASVTEWGIAAIVLLLCADLGTLFGWSEFRNRAVVAPEEATAAGLALASISLGWMIADERRSSAGVDRWPTMLYGSNWPVATALVPVSAVASTAWLGAPAVLVVLVAVAAGAWAVLTWRDGAAALACVMTAYGLLRIGAEGPVATLVFGIASTAALAEASQRARAQRHAESMWTAAVAACVAWMSTMAMLPVDASWTALLVVVGLWLTAWWPAINRSGPRRIIASPAVPTGLVGRVGAFAVAVAFAVVGDAVAAVVACTVVAAGAGIDQLVSARSTSWSSPDAQLLIWPSGLVGAALGAATLPVGELLGFERPTAGVVATILALSVVGVGLVAPARLDPLLGGFALASALLGLAGAVTDPAWFALALVATGVALGLVGLAGRCSSILGMGFALMTAGVTLRLVLWGVRWPEPYLILPMLAALWFAAGAMQRGASSWSAYAPIVAFVGWATLSSRVGGSPWHAVIAGAVAVVAIIGGARRRLAGPLLAGSGLLAATVALESLGPIAELPTWAWLAGAGAVLLVAGVLLERSEDSPLDRSRRAREVLATDYR